MTAAMHRMIAHGLEDDLRDDPPRIPNFIEEVLRLEAPVQGLYRRAVNDITIGEVHIPKGAIVVMRFGAANRDPAQFDDPDALDSHRRNAGHTWHSASARISAWATSFLAGNCASRSRRCCEGCGISGC
jgi:cytochrome P450